MDDLLQEFLTETSESLDVVDVELVRFEQEPNNAEILDNIFRLVHTIKGTCGFLGLPRLESLAHAAETLMGKYRDGKDVTEEGVSLILQSIDRLKAILMELEQNDGVEPEGSDSDLIDGLNKISLGEEAVAAGAAAKAEKEKDDAPIVVQTLERELLPGEVSLEDLEKAFQEAEFEGFPEDEDGNVEAEAKAEEPVAEAPKPEPVKKAPPKKPAAKADDAAAGDGKQSVSNQSLRVNVDTLEDLMTMVSELVLTRNQLLEIVRRHEDSEFKVPLQRLSNVTGELQEGVMKTRMQPIGNAWQKLPRIVRDLANELDKDIDLRMLGAETELEPKANLACPVVQNVRR